LSYSQEVLNSDYISEETRLRLVESFDKKELDIIKSPRELIYSLAYFYDKKDLNALLVIVDKATNSKLFDKLDYSSKLFVANVLVELEHYAKAYYIL